jgi:hypothetical protein
MAMSAVEVDVLPAKEGMVRNDGRAAVTMHTSVRSGGVKKEKGFDVFEWEDDGMEQVVGVAN